GSAQGSSVRDGDSLEAARQDARCFSITFIGSATSKRKLFCPGMTRAESRISASSPCEDIRASKDATDREAPKAFARSCSSQAFAPSTTAPTAPSWGTSRRSLLLASQLYDRRAYSDCSAGSRRA